MKDECPVLEKHIKYKDKYGENEVYWGFGIEVETYLQFAKPIYVAAPILRTARKPERYSVNYYNSYKPETLSLLDTMFPDASGFVPIPLLLNCHSLSKADRNGKHITTYEKVPKPNPAFSGRTVFDEMKEYCPRLFLDEHELSFTFDGDTLEFISQDFYKIKVSKAIRDIVQHKKNFLEKFNEFLRERRIFLDRGPVIYPPKNPGFAVFHTNQRNVGVFNNGTYHINITLPSALGPYSSKGNPTLADPKKFKEQHKNCIRVFQWLEPILIAMYGSADPFPTGSCSSQRGAMSRYMGLGTYDTNAMPEGKIVTVPVNTIRGADQPFWWYKVYHEGSAYQPLEQLGMDINYRKHFLHGIELRIFDWFPEERLQELSEILVYAAEASLLHKNVIEPVMNKGWNRLMVGALRQGKAYKPSLEELGYLEYICGVGLPPSTLEGVYAQLFKKMAKKYRSSPLASCFLDQPTTCTSGMGCMPQRG
jgi:hypothetical protein